MGFPNAGKLTEDSDSNVDSKHCSRDVLAITKSNIHAHFIAVSYLSVKRLHS